MATRETIFNNYNVVACYEDMDHARAAVEALEEAGVLGSNISLLGPMAEQAADVEDTRQRDEAIMREGMKATLGGAAIGSGTGAAVGFVTGAVVFELTGVGPAVAAGVWATTLGGAAAGGGLGFTAGAMARIKQSEAWELTLEDVERGWVTVGAHTSDGDEFQRAVDSLAATNPKQMRRFDARGTVTG